MSPLIESLFLPAGLVGLGLLVCLVLALWRPRDRGARLALATLVAGYYLLSTAPVPNLVIRSLERQAVLAGEGLGAQAFDAIVVLAGGASFGGDEGGPGELNGASWRRLWRGVEVYHELDGKTPILFSGRGRRGDPTPRLALAAATRWGIPADRFWIEAASTNTQASALDVRKLLDERLSPARRHRVALVTSAWHMPRSVAAFARVGVDAVPVPCDFQTVGAWRLVDFLPRHEALLRSTLALHELAGIVAYRLGARG